MTVRRSYIIMIGAQKSHALDVYAPGFVPPDLAGQTWVETPFPAAAHDAALQPGGTYLVTPATSSTEQE